MKSFLGISNLLEEICSLSHSIVFLYLFALFNEEGFFCLFVCFLSLLASLWNSAFKWNELSFAPWPFTSVFSQLCVRPPQTTPLPLWISCTWGFHAKLGTIKDRHGVDLTEEEDIEKWGGKNTQTNYTKKDLHDSDNPDGVITHLEPDILDCKLKWALGSITINKASGGGGIPVELFQILKDNADKVLHSIRQQIWKT